MGAGGIASATLSPVTPPSSPKQNSV
jgi:hypothetical protein